MTPQAQIKHIDQIKYDLEELIDKHGLSVVVGYLSDICYEKMAHIEENWQDPITAKPWRQAGKMLDIISARISEKGL